MCIRDRIYEFVIWVFLDSWGHKTKNYTTPILLPTPTSDLWANATVGFPKENLLKRRSKDLMLKKGGNMLKVSTNY